MTSIKTRMIASLAAFVLLTGCFTGCNQNSSSGASGSKNGLDVSLDYSFQSEKADLGDLINTENFIPVGDMVLAYGSTAEDFNYSYYLYDPESNSSRMVEFNYLKNAPSTAYVENYGMYWDASTNQFHVLFGGYDYPVDENGEENSIMLEPTLEIYDSDMNLVESRPVGNLFPPECYINRICANPGGGCVMSVQNNTTNEAQLCVFDSGFHKTQSIASPYSWIYNLFGSGDHVYVYGYSESSAQFEFGSVDVTEGKISGVSLSAFPANAGQCFPSAVEQYDFFCSDNNFIYGINVATDTCDKVLNFINSDFLAQDICGSITQLKNGKFMFTSYTDDTYSTTNTWVLTERPADAFQNVKMISLASLDMDSRLSRSVLSFNRIHSDVRIAVTDYSKYMSLEDTNIDYDTRFSNAVDKMKSDMTSGIIADIICVSDLPYESFCNKGIFEDMSEHFGAYDQEQFFTNVFDSFRYKDKLFEISPAFTVETLIGKTDKVGSKQGVTLDELMKIIDSCGSDVKPFGSWTRSTAARYLIGGMISSFTDVESGTCSFNTPEFIKLLEFTASLPETDDESSGYEDEMYSYADDKALLMEASMEGCRNAYLMLHQTFDDAPTTFIGYPVSGNGGNGGRIRATVPLAIASNSQCKDLCYEFLDYLMSDDYQRSMNYCFPLNRKVFRENAENDAKPRKIQNEKGKMVDDPLTVYIHDVEKKIPDMPMSFANDLETYIQGIRNSSYSDPQIVNIIVEETNMLYAGDQDAAKAASSIQNRVSLYMQEQK